MYRVLLWLSATAVLAQTPASRMQFEVASVKPSSPPATRDAEMRIRSHDMFQNARPLGVPYQGRTVSVRDYTFVQLVAMAYHLRPSDIAAPSWAAEARFDVEAKLPEGAKAADHEAMMRALLEDRFGLRAHRETRTKSGYALLVGKDGPKLPPPGKPSDPMLTREQMKETMDKRMVEMSKAPKERRPEKVWWSPTATPAMIAAAVADWLQAPVADETRLDGKYFARLEVRPADSEDETLEYRVTQALAKLGLKIESRKVEKEFLVIDSASKTPSEN